MEFNKPMLRDDALKGQVIIVTGGGSGLGKAMTTYFLELGAKVVITSRNLDKLLTTAKELEEKTGGTVLPLACDVRCVVHRYIIGVYGLTGGAFTLTVATLDATTNLVSGQHSSLLY